MLNTAMGDEMVIREILSLKDLVDQFSVNKT
jgi:hypothetical protein